MNNKTIFRIAGMAAAFLGCLAIGYLMPVGLLLDRDDAPLYGSGTGGAVSGSIPTRVSADVPKTAQPVETPDRDLSSEAASQQDEASMAGAPVAEPQPEPAAVQEHSSAVQEPAVTEQTPTAVSTSDDVPQITQALVYDRESKNYQKIGYRFVAKASVSSGDDLDYQLCEVGATQVRYTSANGVFNDVYPVDGGKYDLVVVNKRTGDRVSKTVGGFNKLRRLSASELQKMLNMSSSQLERLFFFYFDHDKLRIDCAAIPEGVDAPTSVGAILDGKVANDWTLEVVGAPQYDQFNRITYFKIKITI